MEQAAFTQTDAIRDFVFPIFDTTQSAEGVVIERFLGSGFIVGSSNLAMTASHVLRGSTRPVAAFARESWWDSFPIERAETHPTEDLTLFELTPPASGVTWKSISRASGVWVGSSAQYRLFGYPLDAAIELVEGGVVSLRPDLVYVEGYVRRRLTHVPLPGIRGEQFLELSAVAGAGFSGSPVYTKESSERWDLIGVYVGEKITEGHGGVGYALRLRDLLDWSPRLVGARLGQVMNS